MRYRAIYSFWTMKLLGYVSEVENERWKNMPSQNMPLWSTDYFELKVIE